MKTDSLIFSGNATLRKDRITLVGEFQQRADQHANDPELQSHRPRSGDGPLKSMHCLALLLVIGATLTAKEPLIHASEIATLAGERGRACQFDDALKMVHQAVREASTAGGDTAATFQAMLETQERDLRKQSDNVRVATNDVKRLLMGARVESSETRLNQMGVPGCGAQLRTEIIFRRAQAREWVHRSHARTNPRDTLADLHRALALDAELPGLGAAIDDAERRKAAQPCHACRVARKTLITVVVVAAVAAGSFYGYRAYKRYENTHH